MMPKFGLILVLLLAKTLAQGDPDPIFKAVGETWEMTFCFGVDYITVFKINEGEKQLLWNSSDSFSPPDAYKNRISAPKISFEGLLGFQVMDLKLSDSGVYLRECWAAGKLIKPHTNYLYVCDEEIPPQELFAQNGGFMLSCNISYSDHDNTSIKWFRQTLPELKISLFLDTERTQEPLQKDLNDSVLQVQDNGFSLYISDAGLESGQNFVCLVMQKGQCKSFKNLELPEDNHSEMQSVYYAVGEKAVLSCTSEHLSQQQNLWETPLGEVEATRPHNQMYVINSERTRDHLLIIPSITFDHSGEYTCLSETIVSEYYVTVCSELVSNNVQLYNGENVILTCPRTQDESVNILWYRQTQLIYDSEDPSTDIPADMMGRTDIIDSNATLIISKLNENDSGAYWCVVLLDSEVQDAEDYTGHDEDEDDNMDDDYKWIEEDEEENTETCIIKSVTQLKIQPKNYKASNEDTIRNTKTESESSPVPYAIIGGVLGILILGLIIVVVVVKMRAKRKASGSRTAEPIAHHKDPAVSAPLMYL